LFVFARWQHGTDDLAAIYKYSYISLPLRVRASVTLDHTRRMNVTDGRQTDKQTRYGEMCRKRRNC